MEVTSRDIESICNLARERAEALVRAADYADQLDTLREQYDLLLVERNQLAVKVAELEADKILHVDILDSAGAAAFCDEYMP